MGSHFHYFQASIVCNLIFTISIQTWLQNQILSLFWTFLPTYLYCYYQFIAHVLFEKILVLSFLEFIPMLVFTLQRTERQTHQQYYEYQQPYELQQATARQGDDGLITTIISLALKYGPTLFNYVLGGGSSAQQQTTDRIEELEIKVGCLFQCSQLLTSGKYPTFLRSM